MGQNKKKLRQQGQLVEASIDILRIVEPAISEVLKVAAANLITVDHTVRARMKAEAEAQFPEAYGALTTTEQIAQLKHASKRFIASAIEACETYHNAFRKAVDAQRTPRAADLFCTAADKMIAAHYRCEEAYGVSRAAEEALKRLVS